MLEDKPVKVETLLETLNLSHLMQGMEASSWPQTVPNKAKIVWTGMDTSPAASHVVRPMFLNPIKRRLFQSQNRLRFDDWETAKSLLISLKPDHLRPVHKPHMSQGYNPSPPKSTWKQRDLETMIPPHKRNMGIRTSLSTQKPRTEQLHFIHLYRFVRLNTVETKGKKRTESGVGIKRQGSRVTPDQILAADYQSPYCLFVKAKNAGPQQRRMGYSVPNPRKITAEIKRLQDEKDRRFDSIIEDVMKEFSLSTNNEFN